MSEDSPSATPRLNHFAVRVDMLSKIVLRERSSEGFETIEIIIHNTQHILHSKEIAMDNTPHISAIIKNHILHS